MLILDEQGWHHAPPPVLCWSACGFFDLSLGYARELQLLSPDAPPEWRKVTYARNDNANRSN